MIITQCDGCGWLSSARPSRSMYKLKTPATIHVRRRATTRTYDLCAVCYTPVIKAIDKAVADCAKQGDLPNMEEQHHGE